MRRAALPVCWPVAFRVVGGPAFQATDVHRAVQRLSVARPHARRRANAAAHRGERLGAQQDGRRAASPPVLNASVNPTTSLPAGQASACRAFMFPVARCLGAPCPGLESRRVVRPVFAQRRPTGGGAATLAAAVADGPAGTGWRRLTVS